MCGIFGYIGEKQTAGEMILAGLKSLEYRGYDSWGISLKQKDGKLYTEKHVGKIGEAKLPKIISSSGIGHTRWATHGGIKEANSHPHLDCKKQIVVVHNGIIENFEELKAKLLKTGHKFKSETDTEVVPHLIEEELKKTKNLKQAVKNVFDKLQGLSAIIVFFPSQNCFITIKNGSPLVFGQGKNEFFLASDSSALSPYTSNVYFLEDDELLFINKDGFELYYKKFRSKSIKFIKLNFKAEEAQRGKYDYFMIKEIYEQPKVITKIALEEEENIKRAAKLIDKAFGTYFVGCGTAYYAALSGTYLFSKIAKKHINSSVASEFPYLLDFIKKYSLIIPLSQSGETIDIVSGIKKAQDKGTKILAITNVLGSTIYRMADEKLLLNAGPEKCVLATKSFTAKIAYLFLLAHSIAGSYKQGVKDLRNATKEIEKLLTRKEEIKKLAEKLKNKEHIYILGRGTSYPTALESALKIKEVSYIHAEGFAAGELKHGVIALIEKGTPVIIYNPQDETYEDTLSSAYEVKARGAYVIGISSKNNKIFDEFIEVANCNDATIIPNVVVAQLLGYYLALAKGFDPDKPRNLAKSVTVK